MAPKPIQNPLFEGFFPVIIFFSRINFALLTNEETMRNRTVSAVASFSFLLFLSCLRGNASKHNDKGVYDRHNHNHEKKIITMLVIMPVFFKHLIVI